MGNIGSLSKVVDREIALPRGKLVRDNIANLLLKIKGSKKKVIEIEPKEIVISREKAIGLRGNGLVELTDTRIGTTILDDKTSARLNKLFYDNGIIDIGKNQYVKALDIVYNEYYTKIEIKLFGGISIAKIMAEQENLAHCFGGKSLRIELVNGIILLKIYNDNIKSPTFRYYSSNNNLILIGVDEEGNPVYWDLYKDHHLLLAGSTGCGKSTVLNSGLMDIIKGNKAILHLIDLKGGGELIRYKDFSCVAEYTDNLEEAAKMTERFLSAGKARAARLGDFDDYLQTHQDTDEKIHLLIIEECNELTKKPLQGQKNLYSDAMIDICRLCRSGGYKVVMTTQKPTRDAIDPLIRANVTGIVGMRVKKEDESEVILGKGSNLDKIKSHTAITSFNEGDKFMLCFMLKKADVERELSLLEKR